MAYFRPKKASTGGVWRVSRGCLEGVLGPLDLVWVYLCPMNWKKLHRYNYYYVSHYPPVAYFQPKNMHFRLSVRCLLGVCWVSGGCQGPSGLCLRCINAKSIGKGLVDIILNKYRIFSQWPIFGQKRLDGPDFQRGVVVHFPAFLAIFIGLYGQVMDLRTYWGGLWKKFWPDPLIPPPYQKWPKNAKKTDHSIAIYSIFCMSHSQMLGKFEYTLPAKFWRLVGCTEMLSW